MPATSDRSFVRLLRSLVVVLVMLAVTPVTAQPKVRMKMELMSIRNRSSGPVPVRVRLEYNDPQILEGRLELRIYDSVDRVSEADRLASYSRDGIVLAGQDYEFMLLMPPLRLSETRNWAVTASFVTETAEIPLSSIPDRTNPPEPFDLLMTSAAERGTVICSACDSPRTNLASDVRRFLETELSLERFNPNPRTAISVEGAVDAAEMRRMQTETGQSVIHFSAEWDASGLPEDPLSYCGFDMVLLSDGGLELLSEGQIKGLETWVRAGGSLCVVPGNRMKSEHLEFLRRVMKPGLTAETDLALDSDGRLLWVSEESSSMVLSHFGLGRAVLLPDKDRVLEEMKAPGKLGMAASFLWKVRRDQPTWEGQPWTGNDLLTAVRLHLPSAEQDETGIYLTNPVGYVDGLGVMNFTNREGRYYLDPNSLQMFNSSMDLFPSSEGLVRMAEPVLLPVNFRMVPTSLIALILMAYVLAIGPGDYFLLGWLKMRKYTWILFPATTAVFTLLTVVIANAYLGNEDSRGQLVITDFDNTGAVVRQTRLETMFLSGTRTVTSEHQREFFVQAEDQYRDDIYMYGRQNQSQDAAISYAGVFPQNYKAQQAMMQWSPVTFRSLSLEPATEGLPEIPWNDPAILEVGEARNQFVQKLRTVMEKDGSECRAMVIVNGKPEGILGNWNFQVYENDFRRNVFYGYSDRNDELERLLHTLPTAARNHRPFFRIVSQVSPQGSALLEDLTFVDPTDQRQAALVIARIRGNQIDFFRKLFLLPTETP